MRLSDFFFFFSSVLVFLVLYRKHITRCFGAGRRLPLQVHNCQATLQISTSTPRVRKAKPAAEGRGPGDLYSSLFYYFKFVFIEVIGTSIVGL